ncbi:hypothetical protein COU54_03370 [Candidatus Pacearchaeota archaeon CG10_big_fil_rev_8_21_14_0_10_31_24]|nr:MAG: hypothetical protein COU54_03370 [Candidatus Pacearchaeota archaeon CG10_big_fil_rev_8_21_14_0_10_31_24]
MLDNKKIEESKKRVEQALASNKVIKEKSGKFVSFFQENARRSFETARLLYSASTQEEMQKTVGFPKFNGFLWVINASYYSMFYMARALLEKSGVKIKTDHSVHVLTFDALVTYFYATGKVERQMLEEFSEASTEAQEALGREKARELMEDYMNEREKRSRFTYEMGEIALENKAKTSLDRAQRFNETLRKML